MKVRRIGVVIPLFVLGAGALMAQFPRATVDPASAARGAGIYAAKCASCHGADARGTKDGPDMIRSEAVLHDRRDLLHGKELGPLLRTLPNHPRDLSEADVADLSQFLTSSVNKILRSGYNDQPTELLSGDAKAGESYFHGAGGCDKCHSPTGNLAHIASRESVLGLQQKLLFPGNGFRVAKKVQVTVKLPSGKSYSGDVVRIDDFNVTLREPDGTSRTFSRTPGTRVSTVDPFAAHDALLSRYTDADIHNLTAYLETLK